jgi:hypothetical protein
LQQEINRLFIAGSKFAQNDPRLQKQAAVFGKLGEKSPVFKKIADGIENLILAESNDSSAKLLEISTLLYAVLYTQGETVEAEQAETELNPTIPIENIFTNKSYLALKPLIEALNDQKEGRMHEVKTAFRDGLFNDFRTYHLTDAALADRYAELADYIENTIIPSIGQPVLPFILNGFSYEGKTDDVRRFRILTKLGYPKIAEMIDEIFAGKSVLLQAEAVKTLSGDPDNEELLVKFASDRQKPIRLAAYEALAILNTETAQQTLVDLFIANKKKSDMTELSQILKINLSNKFIPTLLDRAKNDFDQCLALDKSSEMKLITAGFENLAASVNTLVNNANEDILKFYENVFTNKKYKELIKIAESKAGSFALTGHIVETVIASLENMKEGLKCLKFLAENSSMDDFLYSCFKASVKYGVDKTTVFDQFSKHIDKLLEANMLAAAFLDENDKLNRDNIDSRWTKLVASKLNKKNISRGNIQVYICLAGETSKESQSFLSGIISSYKSIDYDFSIFAKRLIESGYSNAFETIFNTILAMSKNQNPYLYVDDYLDKFPKEYAEKFRKLADVLRAKNSYYSSTFYAAADKIEEAHFSENTPAE